MQIIYRNITDIQPYGKNPRKNAAAIDKVAASIKEFGFKQPIVIDKQGEIIAGHTRYKAAQKLGLTEVPVVIADDLTEAQTQAYRLADNKTAEFAEWDMELLSAELTELSAADFDMEPFGFIPEEDTETKEDDFDVEAAIPEVAITKRGDIWQLGRHRLMCGDSVSEADINKLTDGNPIYLIFTDPPYGMNAVSKSGVLKERYKTDILNDGDNSVAVASFKLCQRLFSQSNQVWWGANYYSEGLPCSECWLVWDKNNGASDQTDCELAWTNFRSVVRQFTMASEKKNRVHPTQKPIRLVAEIVNRFDKQETYKNVLDVFGGSGSTLMACEQTNRICYTMELDEKFCDVIVKRWEEFTGEKAQLINE